MSKITAKEAKSLVITPTVVNAKDVMMLMIYESISGSANLQRSYVEIVLDPEQTIFLKDCSAMLIKDGFFVKWNDLTRAFRVEW